jgi:16S rRNA (guanine966-N2)-methyltransferase
VREALFAIVGPLEGERVIDLFAGSGALAIEALSRGAGDALLVESSARAAAVCRRNLAALGLEARARVAARDWRAALAAEAAAGRRYDLCLIDPPYSLLPRIAGPLASAIAPIVAPGATICVEHARARGGPTPEPLEINLPIAERITRHYGDTAVTVWRLGAGGPG